MKPLHFLGLSLGCVALVGCTHTVIGGNPYESPDNHYFLAMEIHGASGKAFTAKTKKRVYIWLGSKNGDATSPSIDKKYVFTAADVCSDVQWRGSDEVSVDFYDYGDGVFYSDGRKSGAPSNHIARLIFQLDKQTGKFVERK